MSVNVITRTLVSIHSFTSIGSLCFANKNKKPTCICSAKDITKFQSCAPPVATYLENCKNFFNDNFPSVCWKYYHLVQWVKLFCFPPLCLLVSVGLRVNLVYIINGACLRYIFNQNVFILIPNFQVLLFLH